MKKEKGAATLVEYAIVLPVVFAIVFMLLFVGFTMHQKAVMEAATQRSAIYVARTITDPSYENIVEALIRQEYSISDEFAILRQASAKPEEFQRYNDYAEYCKTLAKNWINGILE